jgi:hypothetical protein
MPLSHPTDPIIYTSLPTVPPSLLPFLPLRPLHLHGTGKGKQVTVLIVNGISCGKMRIEIFERHPAPPCLSASPSPRFPRVKKRHKGQPEKGNVARLCM